MPNQAEPTNRYIFSAIQTRKKLEKIIDQYRPKNEDGDGNDDASRMNFTKVLAASARKNANLDGDKQSSVFQFFKIHPLLDKSSNDRTPEDIDTIEIELSKLQLFEKIHVSPDATREFCRTVKVMNFPKPGRIVCAEGDEGDSFYAVLAGVLKVLKRNGKVQEEKAKLKSGDSFGELSLLYGKPRVATVVVDQPAVLLYLNKSNYDAFLKPFHQEDTAKKREFLSNLIAFHDYSEEDIEAVLAASSLRRWQTGTIIASETSIATELAFIMRGQAQAYRLKAVGMNVEEEAGYVQVNEDGGNSSGVDTNETIAEAEKIHGFLLKRERTRYNLLSHQNSKGSLVTTPNSPQSPKPKAHLTVLQQLQQQQQQQHQGSKGNLLVSQGSHGNLQRQGSMQQNQTQKVFNEIMNSEVLNNAMSGQNQLLQEEVLENSVLVGELWKGNCIDPQAVFDGLNVKTASDKSKGRGLYSYTVVASTMIDLLVIKNNEIARLITPEAMECLARKAPTFPSRYELAGEMQKLSEWRKTSRFIVKDTLKFSPKKQSLITKLPGFCKVSCYPNLPLSHKVLNPSGKLVPLAGTCSMDPVIFENLPPIKTRSSSSLGRIESVPTKDDDDDEHCCRSSENAKHGNHSTASRTSPKQQQQQQQHDKKQKRRKHKKDKIVVTFETAVETALASIYENDLTPKSSFQMEKIRQSIPQFLSECKRTKYRRKIPSRLTTPLATTAVI